jgi:hypothetical protein
MANIEPDVVGTDETDDELEITDLRPRPAPSQDGSGRALGSRLSQLSQLDTHVGKRLAFVLVVGLVLAAVLSALPHVGDMLGMSKGPAVASKQASPNTWSVSQVEVGSISVTPAATSDVQGQPAPALGPAPATCGDGQPPAMTHVGPPALNEAIGRAPVWVGGFSGTYPTLALGPDAQKNSFGWDATYTLDGWPAPIILVVQSGFQGSVVLTGWDTLGRNVQFGLVEAGVWGAPEHVLTAINLNPAQPDIPAGGSDNTGVFWYGYIFLSGAGCYTLNAAWPGGSWSATVSAGLPR